MAVIRTEHLSHVYSEGTPFVKMAIQDVNLSIEEGEMVGVIGHTGSGKSTLIQHLNGLLKPTSGKIYIDGEDMWADKAKLREIRFKVGLVFQYPEYQLFEETVYRDIAFGPKNMGLSEEEVDKRVRQAAAFVNVTEEMMNKSPFELSGGQKRRVAIAGVLAMNPKVLILDEPTAGLDPKGRDRILGQIQEYQQDQNAQKKYLDFLRAWLKDKDYVALAYMTGILPIKKYGSHSALNMFTEYSRTDPGDMAEYFGFTEQEVSDLCKKYQMSFDEAKQWYDGYDLIAHHQSGDR